ncbi:MAG: DUF4292 domain-containing protein [Flavobacteriales bacterium]
MLKHRITTLEHAVQLRIGFAMVLTLLVALVACSKSKNVEKSKEPLKERTAGYLLRHYDKNKYDYTWVGMKVDAEFITMGETQTFKATIRMRKDSVIWVSITPLLGFEMIRLMLTPDSLYYLSKIPDNKYYYKGGFDVINQLVGVELDFEMLQDMLVGNALALDKDEGRFRSEVNDDKHLLISRYKRKVRRVVGMDDRKLEDDTIVVNPNDPRYQRTLKHVDEDDELIVSRYWLEPEQYRLVQSIFNDLIKQRTVEIYYSDFMADNEQTYPAKCHLKAKSPEGTRELKFEITKLSSDKPYELLFEIPEDYPKRDSL